MKKVYIDRTVYYNENKLQHNIDGPAVEYFFSDIKEYWIDGKQYSESEFKNFKRSKTIKKILK